ncbi:MAG TPA: alpha-amylase family glycosyl hydrolase, partial [Longimicrobiaceae bacterium]|nr:alpha-amylase family glycosyl hydrolase [Longimicrobiaceae bacterium]
MAEKTLAEIDFAALTARRFTPSPAAWEDQALYFLMLDRFSDGNEQGYLDNEGSPVATGTTPMFQLADAGNAVATGADADRWNEAGIRFVGGTLAGLRTKLEYLKRLGVTGIWVSPVFRQLRSQESYHGYGIQHFLDVDPRFGTRDDLRALVEEAHRLGIYVILDIIFNHAGDVFAYDPDRYLTPDGRGGEFLDPRWDDRPYRVAGFRDRDGSPT